MKERMFISFQAAREEEEQPSLDDLKGKFTNIMIRTEVNKSF
jgi:hypothetical protein